MAKVTIKKLVTPEKTIQKQVVRYIKFQYPNLFFFSVRNEGKRSLREGKEAKDMGLLSGVSDLYFLHNGKSLFLELKNEKGKQSDTQKGFEESVTKNGAIYIVANSFDSAIEAIKNFLEKT
jgi:hypothetical protein